MSRWIGSSVIPVAVFLAILLIVLPAGADNVTITETTVTPSQTTAAPTGTAVIPNQTTVAPAQTTAATTQTTVATTQTTATPNATTVATRPATVVTTASPAPPVTEAVTTGSVNVYSSPAGASILIDGVYSGTTPKTVNGVPAGNHILRLTLSGYYDYEGPIYIVAGQPAQGYGTLQPLPRAVTAAPTPVPTAIAVIVPVVTATPVPAQDPGLLENSSVLAAVIGAIAVIIATAVKIFTHVRPPKTE